MYRQSLARRSDRIDSSSHMASDSSDGGAPLFSPRSPSIKKISMTVESDEHAIASTETRPIAPTDGGAPVASKSEGNDVEFSADNRPKLNTNQGSKLDPSTEPFIPPSPCPKNIDIKVVKESDEKGPNSNSNIVPNDDHTDVLLKMIKETTARSTSRIYEHGTNRLVHSRTFNDGFNNAPSFSPGKNDNNESCTSHASSLSSTPAQFQKNRESEFVQNGDFDGNGNLYSGQQMLGNWSQSLGQGNGYNAAYTTIQHGGNPTQKSTVMYMHGYNQQNQSAQQDSQYIATQNTSYAACSSGELRMPITASQQSQHAVSNRFRDNNAGYITDGNRFGQITAAQHVMEKYASPTASSYSIQATTQMAPGIDGTISYPSQAIAPNQAPNPGSTSGIEELLGITKPTPMFQPPSPAIKAQRSHMLNRLVGDSGRPTINSLMDPETFPFIEPARTHTAVDHGVVKLKNIPYSTTRSEIIAVLGKNAKILNDNLEPVHIIMERVTSKTQDAYVEVLTLDDAIDVVDRYYSHKNRAPRLGDRPIDIEVSSQSQLMNDLFPIASGVIWHGCIPEIKPHNGNEPWDNFKTFVTAEEMTMLVKHVEVPQRSPFSRESPERPYESIISTLKKMPWYMTAYITLKQRHVIYEACCKLVSLLRNNFQKRGGAMEVRGGFERAGAERLTEQLYRRLIKAIMLCPGFTVCQKDNVAALVGMGDLDLRDFNMPRFSHSWLHLYTLGPKPGVPLDVLEYYIALIREETNRAVQATNIREKQELANLSQHTDGYWGFFWREVGYMKIAGVSFDAMTLAGAAAMEWEAIDRILRRALLGGEEDGDNGGSDHSGSSRKKITGGESRAMLTH